MEVRAIAKSVRVSPRKLRLVVDAMKNMPIDKAFQMLQVTNKRAATVVGKTLQSAVANAVNNAKLDQQNLLIASITVNDAPAFKRFRPSTRGRIHPYKKRGSHLTIVLKEKAVVAPVVTPKTVVKKETKKEAEKVEKGGKK